MRKEIFTHTWFLFQNSDFLVIRSKQNRIISFVGNMPILVSMLTGSKNWKNGVSIPRISVERNIINTDEFERWNISDEICRDWRVRKERGRLIVNLARRRRININTLILSDLTSHRELFCISVSNVVNIFIFVAYCIYMKITTLLAWKFA